MVLNQKKTEIEISTAMKKYLIGHEYHRMLKNAEEMYERAAMEKDEIYMSTHKLNCKQTIAKKLAERCNVAKETVINYSMFAGAIDEIELKNEDLATQILTGKTRVTYESMRQMLHVL